MKRENFGRQVILLFLAVVAGYAAVYYFIQTKRVTDGPWVVKFINESSKPELVVNQNTLGLRDVRIVFPNAQTTNVAETVAFGVPRGVPFAVPFGECIFFDARFLPGTVVLSMFGHEIQFLPRVLTIDRVERPWKPGEIITLTPMPATNSTAMPTKQY